MKCEISAAHPVMIHPAEHPSFQSGDKTTESEVRNQITAKKEPTQIALGTILMMK